MTASDSIPSNLIQTKLYRPSISRDLVHRARLVEQLDRGCELPLTLVSAPAGSGKTMLLSDWLGAYPRRSAWLSLDGGDSELSVFLSYFVAAIRTVFPLACEQTWALLHAAELPSVPTLASVLSNEIGSLGEDHALPAGQRFILVLDDYHMVRNQAIQQFLTDLLRHPPLSLHLVLSTRQDPPLPIASLRARGQLGEIRMEALRFTSDEIAAFMQRTIEFPVDPEIMARVEERTEGWIVGLRLAALSLVIDSDSNRRISQLPADNRYAMDYLLGEVLLRLPRATQTFLLKTSILDRLSGPLCDAVTGLDAPGWNGQCILEWLVEKNVFTMSLDSQGQWYRYHHLFRSLLRSQLARRFSAQAIADLHASASAWCGQNGFVEDAIVHALAAGDETAVVEIIEAQRHVAMNQERWSELDHWLRLVPRRLVDERPELLLLEAWILQQRWRFADIPQYLDSIDALIAQTPPPEPRRTRLRSEIDTLRSLHYYYTSDEEQTSFFARRALQTVPMEYSSVRGLAWMYYASGLQLRGDFSGTQIAFAEALKEDSFHRNSFPTRVLIALCVFHWITADLSGLTQTANRFLVLASERNLAESAAWARYFRGCAAYQLNDLAGAENDFSAVVGRRYVAHSHTFSQGAFGLATVYQAQGRSDQARAVIESVVAYGSETNNTRVLADAQMFRAWLATQQGQQAEGQPWVAWVNRTAPLTPMTTFYVSSFAVVKLLLHQATPASLREALGLLSRLRAFAEATHNTRFLIDVLALQALLDDAQGREQAALLALQQAVTLAQPGGILRVFLDLGPNMADLLDRLGRQKGAPDYVEQILQAFPVASRPHPSPARLSGRRRDLVETLTNREMEVLQLLARRLSAKEIAQQLVISDRTVKRHTANIYGKLGVNDRRQAVRVAGDLGILRPG